MVKRLFNIVNQEIRGLHEAAYLLAFFAFLSQILALIRDKLLAYNFGAGVLLDVYYSAFRIPDLIFVSIASLVSASVLVPFFIDKYKNNKDKGQDFVDSIFSAFFFLITSVSVVVYFLIPDLTKLLLPGFSESKYLNDLILASRILLLSPIFLGISNFLSSITQMHKRFLIYALSPIVYNIGIIIGILFLYPLFGFIGLVFGVVIGAFLHLTIQIPFIFNKGIFPHVRFNIDWGAIRKVIFVSLPRTLTLSSNQLASFFLVSLASLMSGGSISIFNLASNLQSVPMTIIGMSYSSAVFPTLSKFFVEKKRDEFLKQMVDSARHIVFWSMPVMILFIVLRAQIVRTIYGAGSFDWADTRLTAAALAVFVVSIIGQSLVLLFVRAYYAEGKTKKPLIINITSGLIIVVLGYLFTKLFFAFPIFRFFLEDLLKVSGQVGTSVLVLPLAYSIDVLFNTYMHWHMFENDYRGFTRPVIVTLFQSFASSVIMGYITFLSLRFFNIFFPLTKAWNVFFQGFFAGIVGIIAGVIVLILLKNKEIKEVWTTLHHKFWKSNVVVPDQETL
jgi:putative peptidoglycan lipid II flippase